MTGCGNVEVELIADERFDACCGHFYRPTACMARLILFEGWHLPHGGPEAGFGSLGEKKMVVFLNGDDAVEDGFDGGLVFFDGVGFGVLLGEGAAVVAKRAGGTGGIAGCANGGAEFHEGLVEVAWGAGEIFRLELIVGEGDALGFGAATREKGVGDGPEVACGGGLIDGGSDGEKPGEDADDVAVDEWGALPEGDGGDGACAVGADAGECEQVVGVVGDGSVVVVDDGDGGGVEIAGAAVVAEALPEVEDVLFIGAGEVGDGGIFLGKSVEVIDHSGDLRLLEHGFGEQNVVRIGEVGRLCSPGHGAVIFVVPAQKGAANEGAFGRWDFTIGHGGRILACGGRV